MSVDEVEEAAIHAMGRGWPVFPVTGKTPATRNGVKDASRQISKVRGWWGRHDGRGIGMATGEPSGVWALDLDGEEGRESIRRLQEENGSLPDTVASRTGGGGYHLLFEMPEDRDVRNSAKQVADGVDVRGTGGYIVIPPSPHPSGNRYEWVRPPEEYPVAEAPEWLLALVTNPGDGEEGHEPADALPDTIPKGQRNNMLTSLAGSMRRRGASNEAIQAALQAENEARCQPPLPADEVDDIAESISRYEPEDRTEGSAGPYPGIVRLSDVEPETVRWLWPDRVPLGKLTILEGNPGRLKSTITLDLGARLSREAPMPDGTRPEVDGPGGTVLLTAEDGLADTVRPRFDAAGGDPERVAVVKHVPTDDGDLRMPHVEDIPALERALDDVDAKLVVVDPLMAFLPDEVDSYRDQDVRRALTPLTELAGERGVAVVAIRHLTKSGGSNPLYRGGGSIGLIGAARAGLLVAEDPDAPDTRRILAPTKANLSERAPSLALRPVEADNGAVRVEWAGETDHTAHALLAASGKERTKVEEAADVLQEKLQSDPVAVEELKDLADRLGIGWRTFRRAKKKLGVKADKQGFDGGWYWLLAEGGQGERPTSEDGDVTDLGNGPEEQGSSEDKSAEVGQDSTLADFERQCACGNPLSPDATRCGECTGGMESDPALPDPERLETVGRDHPLMSRKTS